MPRLLDLFCCEGGAAMGYSLAGFEVVGVDIVPQPRYPFEFVQADALEYVAEHGRDFDAIHASPPCQAHSTITPDKSKHVDLIPATRAALQATGLPYVIENVQGARGALLDPVLLCGSTFGLGVRRHRLFESNVFIPAMVCRHAEQGVPVGVYGDHADTHSTRPDGTSRGRKAHTLEEAREAMGMPWASWHGCTQGIPPVFTEWIGAELVSILADWEANAA